MLLGRDLNLVFLAKKMNPNFNLFMGSVGFILAEKPGFEPGLRYTRTTPLAGEPLQPLGYFSVPFLFSLTIIPYFFSNVNLFLVKFAVININVLVSV